MPHAKTIYRHLCYLLTAIGMAAAVSCATEDLELTGQQRLWPDDALSVLPRLTLPGQQASRQQTRAKDDTDADIVQDDLVNARDELRENFLGTLDVFVKLHDAAESAPWFKQYHLVAGEGEWITDPDRYLDDSDQPTSLLDQARQLLADNWASEGYTPGTEYDIYVTANNAHTGAGNPPASLQALKALDTSDTYIYRYSLGYQPVSSENVSSTNYMYQNADKEFKQFLMDGKIEQWTVDPNAKEQEFDVDLRRAAAKIIVNIRFDDEEETMPLVSEDGTQQEMETDPVTGHESVKYGTFKEYLAYVGREPGLPRWKYVNFGLRTADIADGSYTIDLDGTDLDTYGGNFNSYKNEDDPAVKNIDASYTINTYSYSFDWDPETQFNKIPYILVSFAYTKTDNSSDRLICYYRIPVCDESVVSSLDRNNIYIVDATISSIGSFNENLELQDENVRVEYHVIPWNSVDPGTELTTVSVSDTKYLMVTPTTYTLKGDNTQSVDLQYFASISTDDGRYVDINDIAITYENYLGNTVTITGTTVKQVETSPGTWANANAANTDGTKNIRYTMTAPTSGANGEKVIITITPEGLITVQSEALASRAVKDIQFDVELNSSGLNEEHVHIRHFPLDNIQSIAGSWSSRWDGASGTVTSNEYSWNPAADGWDSWDGYEDDVQCTQQKYNIAESEHRYIGTAQQTVETTRAAFLQNVTTNADRAAANSEANAVNGYWGTGATDIDYQSYDPGTATIYDGWDFWDRYWGGRGPYTDFNMHKYSNYYTKEDVPAYYARRYYRSTTTTTDISTGDWVDWEKKRGTITSEGIYDAKIYNGGVCKYINYNNGNYSIGYSVGSSLTNNHMYVVQITSASSKYALGYPTLDGNYQSTDKVVSPAFMIASQLGAVTNTNSPTTAASHCGTYMEVGTDGTRYVNWRLPTKQEIEVIIDYQNGSYTKNITMVEVLGGRYYWSLDGTSAFVSTGSQGQENNAYVRCVRDLTLDELNKLNGNGESTTP